MINTTTIGRLIGLRPIGMAAVAVFAGGGLALAAGSTPSHAPAKPHHHTAGASASEHAAMPHPSMHGLCHAYQAGVANGHGKKLSNPAFSALVSSAGGRAGLTGYCNGLIGPRAAHPDANDRGESERHSSGKHVPPGLAKKHR